MFVVLSLSFLLLFASLAVDFGLAYLKTVEAQNAADAAALAAGMLLPVDVDDLAAIAALKETAVLYAAKNGASALSTENVTLGAENCGQYTSLEVEVSCGIELNIGKIFGVDFLHATRRAQTAVSVCKSMSGLVPLGVDYQQLETLIAKGNTTHIYLKYGGGDGDTGSYGAIDMDGVMGGGASDFETWLTYGYDGLIEVGENLLPVEKGNMAGATYDAMAARYNACTHFTEDGGCTAEHYDPDCPRLIKVMVIEKVGTSYVKVRGFAAFIIEGVYDDVIIGSYVKYLEDGDVETDTSWDSAGYGVYAFGLCG